MKFQISSKEQQSDDRIKRKKSHRVVIVVLALLLTASVGASAAVIYQYMQIKQRLSSPTKSMELEQKRVLAKLSKIMVLPEEDATIAKVEDKASLANDPLFSRAENGDYVVVFRNAQRAILYRESSNQVVDAALINLSEETESHVETLETEQTSQSALETLEAAQEASASTE